MTVLLREQWRQTRVVKMAMAPVRGPSLEDLFRSTHPSLHIEMMCKRSPARGIDRGPYTDNLASKTFETMPRDLRAEISRLEREAKQQTEQVAQVIENMGGIDRIVLVGWGNTTERVLLAERSSWSSPWRKPTKPFKSTSFYAPSTAYEPISTFFNHMEYGSDEDLLRVFVEDVAGGVYDDRQFSDVEVGQTVTVYRGISLPEGADPVSSAKRDTNGVGSSWTLSEESAMAIAERGMAGFSGDNIRYNDVHWLQLRVIHSKPGINDAWVPTVLRAEVTIDPEGAAPYRPWSQTYTSEIEIDIPKGKEMILMGVKQADPVPVDPAEKRRAERAWELSKRLEEEGNLEDPAWMDGRQAGYYVHWRWQPYRRVNVRRTAGACT